MSQVKNHPPMGQQTVNLDKPLVPVIGEDSDKRRLFSMLASLDRMSLARSRSPSRAMCTFLHTPVNDPSSVDYIYRQYTDITHLLREIIDNVFMASFLLIHSVA